MNKPLTRIKTPLIFLLLAMLGTALWGQGNIVRYEAEAGSFHQMTLTEDSTASGGQCLSIEKSSKVTWEIPVDLKGYYQITIRYRTGGGDKMQYLLKNDAEIELGFEMSPNWNLFSQPFYLDSGVNNLGIREGWGDMDVDWISIGPPHVRFGITPRHHTFYKEAPHDLVFKVDNFHQQVKEVHLAGYPINYSVTPYPHQESAIYLELKAVDLLRFPPGKHDVSVKLENTDVKAGIAILREPVYSDLVMVAPDVGHGSSMLLRLPSGKNMLIDCGTARARDNVVVPMLRRHGIDTIHTLILTHYHGDHDGGDSGRTIIQDFHVEQFMDYNTHPTGYEWEADGVNFKIVNSYSDGDEENTRSLAIRISYNGFNFMHGGDTYAVNQQKILSRFPADVPAQVYYANHHFHGSVDPEYVIETNPDLVILQAQQAIYGRAAYMVKYKRESEKVLNKKRSIPIETLPALEVGTIVLRIDGAGEWGYETYRKQENLVIPGFE